MPPIDTRQFAAYRLRVFTDRDLATVERRIDALRAHPEPLGARIAHKLDRCCREPMVFQCTETATYRIHEARCRSRVCPRCARFRAWSLTTRITECVKRMDAPRFLTLTMRSSDSPLREQLITLRKHFANLRRSPLWKKKVVAGVYAIEVTINEETRLWHPHIHVIMDGDFVAQRQLLAVWESIVGDRAGVHIRIVPSASQIARYISSYVVKTSHLDKLSTASLAEWAIELHGLRLAQTFGALHGVKVIDDPEPHPRSRPFEFDLDVTAWMARAGCRKSDDLLLQLAHAVPIGEEWSPDYMLQRIREHSEGIMHRLPPARPPPDPQLSLSQLHADNPSETGQQRTWSAPDTEKHTEKAHGKNARKKRKKRTEKAHHHAPT